jgi:PTH1 family peptidyl-tRNA hydrolase
MDLIVGLGNIGREYEQTRHNIGFMLIDKILSTTHTTKINKSAFKGELFKSDKFLFLKPNTYMNRSGESVSAVANFYKPERIIVIHDDLDLNMGALKFKKGGGHGGHNGLRSIDSFIGKDYYRVRMGIGKPVEKSLVVDFVLGKFKSEEKKCLEESLEVASESIFNFDDNVSNKYTRRGC